MTPTLKLVYLVAGEGDSERLPQRVLRDLLLDEIPEQW